MDFVGLAIDLAIRGAEYLATLPEKDRQKVIEQWRAQASATAEDRAALVDELEAVKAAHEALKQKIAEGTP